MKVKIKFLKEGAKLPSRKHDNDACFDVVATSKKDLGDGRIVYGLGFAYESPENTQIDFRSRSSVHETGLILSNCIGTWDEGYRGECAAVFYHVLPNLKPYEVGDRIGQIQLRSREDVEWVEADELAESDRGAKGWGSTGRGQDGNYANRDELKEYVEKTWPSLNTNPDLLHLP